MVSDRIITSSQHWPRRVYCWDMALLTCSHLGFALVAHGFWGAMTCRTLAGIGWAGAYIPGLKVLSDRLERWTQWRGLAWHAAAIGASAAYPLWSPGRWGSAVPDARGTTLAVHSTLGYAGSAVGPLMVGWILDLAGGQSVFGWGMAFAHAALVMVVGPLALLHYCPQALAGDHGALASGAPVASPCVRA